MKNLCPILPALFLLFLTACSSSDNEGSNDEIINMDPPVESEAMDPVITVNNLVDASTIEVRTDVEISVTADSEVTTNIYINDTEAFVSEERQFTYSFNPYPIAVGPATIRITTTDADNNTVEESFTVDIKHLLFTTDAAEHEVNDTNTIWDMVHSLEGELLSVEKLVVGLNKLYTEDLVETDEVYYSRVYYESNDALFRRVGTVYTYPMELGAHRNVSDRLRTNLPNSNRFRLTVDGLPQSDYLAYCDARGTTYETSTFGSGSNGTSFEVNSETGFEDGTDLLFYTNQSRLVALENGGTGKKEDYKYLIFENPQDQDDVVVQEADFNGLSSSFQLDLPLENTTYNIERYGFEASEDLVLETYNNHRIFSHAGNTQTYVDLPIFDRFEHYRNYVFYVDGTTNYRNTFITFGNEVDLNEIAGEIAFESMGNVLALTAAPQDVDALRVAYRGAEDDNGDNYWDNFNWYYRLKPNNGPQNQIVLDLPQQVTDEFENTFLFDQGLTLDAVDVIDYQKINGFDDFIFTFILEAREDPLENGYRIKSLRNDSNTNKRPRTLQQRNVVGGLRDQ